MAERIDGVRSILNSPVIYRFVQKCLGMEKSRNALINQYIRPYNGMRILDVGCGPAEILDYLPQDIQYVGIDLNPAYISGAKKKYVDRGQFHNKALMDIDINSYGEFDLVLGTGLLHHLDDIEAIKFFSDASKCLAIGGRAFTIDPVFVDGQHWIARILANMDRGQNVRTPEEYRSLASQNFNNIEFDIRHDRLKVPYSHMMLECTKG